jgi:putative FmdB family regulatory protein
MLYEYECDDCGHIQEEMHGMNEQPTINCEKCKSTMHRLITGGTGFLLRGDGWTSTGSRFKQSMTKKNEQAAAKSARHKKPVTKLSDLNNG